MRRLLHSTIVFLAAVSGAAQQQPIFDPDDFVDPRQLHGPAFMSRLVVGGAANFVDDYRPLDKSVGFLHIANSVYWKQWQFDYKHSETRPDGGTDPVVVCGCSPPIYFPTPPPPDAIPAAPPQGSRDSLQFGWYRESGGGPAEPAMMRRYRLTWSRTRFDNPVESATGQPAGRLRGREQSIGLDADTHFSVGGRDFWGSLLVAHTAQSGTPGARHQTEFVYVNRFPGWPTRRILLHATVGIGGVTNRGGTVINVVNPAIEALWHDHRTRANVHLVWSGLAANSGARGWETNHQIAFFVDRALFVKLWR